MKFVKVDSEKIREIVERALSYKDHCFYTIDVISPFVFIEIQDACVDLRSLVSIAQNLCSVAWTRGQVSCSDGCIRLAFWKSELKAEFILPDPQPGEDDPKEKPGHE